VRQSKDGHRIDVSLSISPVRDASGKITAAAGFARDISDLNSDTVFDTRQRLTALLANSFDAIVSKDLDGIILSWNDAATQMYGFTAEEAEGKPIELLIPEDKRAEERQIRSDLAAGKTVQHYETVRQRKDGGRIDVSLSISPVRDASDKIIAAAGFARDISERKRLAEAWKELSFQAAHKLGNPVFALETDLQSLAGLLEHQRVDGALDLIDDMRKLIEKDKSIIDQFKSLSRARDLQSQATDLISVIEEACDVARKRGIHVEIESGEHLVVWADRSQLGECFDELVRNAMNRQPDVHAIRVSMRSAIPKELPSGLDPARAFVVVTVQDDGPGVKLEDKEEIFSAFFSSNHDKGTGLGLYIVQTIISSHGGEIREVGQYGKGAKFEVFLPIDIDETEPHQEPR
jgi:PAS domain S-box-containing protein